MRFFWVFIIFVVLYTVQTNAQGTNRIKGLKGADSLSISRVWSTSLIVPGYAQAYNRDYWKIPVLYGGVASLIYAGAHSHSRYKATGDNNYLSRMRLFYAGAGLLYLGGVLDGVYSYKSPQKVIPAKAAILSGMLPGLGQAYNNDYWKIPVIYGGFAFLGYWYDLNQMQYKRFKTAFNQESARTQDSSLPPSEFNGRMSLDGIRSYRDSYKRDRDYAMLYIVLWYGLNIIDANVFAHMSSFDVGDDLALNVSPTLFMPDMYASNSPNITPGIGLSLRLKIY